MSRRFERPLNEINESNDSYAESIHVSADQREEMIYDGVEIRTALRWQSNLLILA